MVDKLLATFAQASPDDFATCADEAIGHLITEAAGLEDYCGSEGRPVAIEAVRVVGIEPAASWMLV